jgi:hypothetical protein
MAGMVLPLARVIFERSTIPCILFCIIVLIVVQSWGSITAVTLSPKAWPNVSASGALASIIASHLYNGSRLAKTTSTASAPSVGGFRSRLGLPICPQYFVYQRSHNHERWVHERCGVTLVRRCPGSYSITWEPAWRKEWRCSPTTEDHQKVPLETNQPSSSSYTPAWKEESHHPCKYSWVLSLCSDGYLFVPNLNDCTPTLTKYSMRVDSPPFLHHRILSSFQARLLGRGLRHNRAQNSCYCTLPTPCLGLAVHPLFRGWPVVGPLSSLPLTNKKCFEKHIISIVLGRSTPKFLF